MFWTTYEKDSNLLVKIGSNSKNYTQQDNINTKIPTGPQLQEIELILDPAKILKPDKVK